jgi:hypothetical protein
VLASCALVDCRALEIERIIAGGQTPCQCGPWAPGSTSVPGKGPVYAAETAGAFVQAKRSTAARMHPDVYLGLVSSWCGRHICYRGYLVAEPMNRFVPFWSMP